MTEELSAAARCSTVRFPVAIRSDEVLQNRFFQAPKPLVVGTGNELDSLVVGERANFSQDLWERSVTSGLLRNAAE